MIAKYVKYIGIGIVHFLSCMGYMVYPEASAFMLFAYICLYFYVGRHIKDEDDHICTMVGIVGFGVILLIVHIFKAIFGGDPEPPFVPFR